VNTEALGRDQAAARHAPKTPEEVARAAKSLGASGYSDHTIAAILQGCCTACGSHFRRRRAHHRLCLRCWRWTKAIWYWRRADAAFRNALALRGRGEMPDRLQRMAG
jgi:hypothetical protein